MAKTKSLEDLFVNLLKDMYYAEKQIVKTLPKLAKHAEFGGTAQGLRASSEGDRRTGATPRAGVRPVRS